MDQQEKKKYPLTKRPLKTEAEHEEATKIIIASFLKLNPFWKRLPPHPSDFHANIMYRVKRADKYDMTVGYYLNGQLAGVTVTCPVEDYLTTKPPAPKHPESELYGLLAPYFVELDKELVANITPGRKAFIWDVISVKPEFATGGIARPITEMMFEGERERGFHESFLRTSNPITLYGSKQYGYKLLKQVFITEGKFKGLDLSMMHQPNIYHLAPRL